jgi:uncharacterized glyoxalase superfamily protein PhnB
VSNQQQGLSRRRSDPEAFRARALSAALTVKDLDTSVDWYCHAIGFIIDKTYERNGVTASVAIKAGAVRLLLNQDDGAKGDERAKGVGMSLYLTTVQDIDALAERIIAEGWTLATPPFDMPNGTRGFRVKDPDGFMLSIANEATDQAS